MYELIRINGRCHYIDCPAKVGVGENGDGSVCLVDGGSDKDAAKKGSQGDDPLAVSERPVRGADAPHTESESDAFALLPMEERRSRKSVKASRTEGRRGRMSDVRKRRIECPAPWTSRSLLRARR